MNSAQDALYQLHQLQAERLGYVPLPYDKFCARLQKKTNITGLLLPPAALNIKIQTKEKRPFHPTRLYITSNAAAAVSADELRKAIERHAAGDWGLLDEKDWRKNDQALRNGGRLFSVYAASNGKKFCVITRADRVVTTVLLPEDD